MTKPYVHSNYERIKDDDYQTIDPRCVRALVECVTITGHVVDCCSSHGSAIVNQLAEFGLNVDGVLDAFSDFHAKWVVTNPPYARDIVDKIIYKQIERVEKEEIVGFATLMRSNFDFAKTRWNMFTNTHYAGQVRMMFRPWWSEDKKAQPIHNFVWHIWRNDKFFDYPIILYWKEG